jgi:16S rRNA G966 N2-methylase RsmD
LGHAADIAEEIGCPFLSRSHESLDVVRENTGRQHVIVVTSEEVRLVSSTDTFWFHPNMARSRIEAVLRREVDRLAAFMELKRGDRFLDVTCGLGADAITAAHVVGDEGHVMAVERSPILSAIVRHGMKIYKHRTDEVVSAMRRVEVVTADSADFLTSQDDGSWDVVYFDPMFKRTVKRSKGLEVVRALGWSGPTTTEHIGEARRVAKRYVVMKDGSPGHKLKELGFDSVSINGRICYGRIGPRPKQ